MREFITSLHIFSIVKTRCQLGVALVEIKWEKDVSQVYNIDMKWENCPETFTTLENHQVIYYQHILKCIQFLVGCTRNICLKSGRVYNAGNNFSLYVSLCDTKLSFN